MKRPRDLDIDLSNARVLTTALPAGVVASEGPPPTSRGRNKYGAIPTVHGGVRYDSKAEAARAAYLDSLAPAGLWYVRQPTFRLGCPENVYRADFLVVPGRGGVVHVEDVKGVSTAKFNRDVKLWRAYGPCELHVITNGKLARIIPGVGKETT